MSAGNESCCMCMRMTDECGIVAGSTPGSLVCGSCANDVIEAIRRKEEERAAKVEAPVTLEAQALDVLQRSEKFIADGFDLGFLKMPVLDDRERDILPDIRNVIAKMREVMAA